MLGIHALQIPVSFFALMRYGTNATVLVPYISNTHTPSVVEYTFPLQFPCVVLSVILVVCGLRARKRAMHFADSSEPFDSNNDNARDTSFWTAVCSFYLVKSFLIMHYVDIYALALVSFLSIISMLTSCKPIDKDTVGMRIVGIISFIMTTLIIVSLVIPYCRPSEVYVLGICVMLDGILIVGHTWDYPDSTIQTISNCRMVYLTSLQFMLPAAIMTGAGAL